MVIRLLPFILIPVLIIAGLGYWRFVSTKQETPESAPVASPIEVPKTLPAIPSPPTPVPTTIGAPGTPDPRVAVLESAVTELKARISTLENATPAPVIASGKSTVYIPLGSGGSSGDKNWLSNDNYGATIDPAEYPGYSTMQLEVNFRMVQKSGTAYARLYNVTDANAKEQVSTTLDSFSWQTSFGFTLPAGKKTYTLQTKSSEGAEIQLQSARIKVNF